MKTILFFTPTLTLGGVEKVFITYANGLCDSYKVIYAFSDYTDNILKVNLDKRVLQYSLGSKRVRELILPLAKAIRNIKPDYVMTGGDIANSMTIIASFLSMTKTKVILSQHNYIDVESARYSPKTLINLFYKRAYKILSVSYGIEKFLLQLGVDKEKVKTIYNPIDIEGIEALSKKGIESELAESEFLVAVGRLDKVKNLQLMIKAFAIAQLNHPKLRLVLIGNGAEREKLQNLAFELGVEDKVIFTGALSNPFCYIRHAKAVLSSSFSEAMPTIFLEAFTLGKTIVSTPSKGAIELLSNSDLGFLISCFDNEKEYALTIEQALCHPKDVSTIKDFASKFALNKKIEELKLLLS
jgi:putative glycosyltransferase